jgi:hypothetical protein
MMDSDLTDTLGNNTGTAHAAEGQSVTTFLSSLVTGTILFLVQFSLFLYWSMDKRYDAI